MRLGGGGVFPFPRRHRASLISFLVAVVSCLYSTYSVHWLLVILICLLVLRTSTHRHGLGAYHCFRQRHERTCWSLRYSPPRDIDLMEWASR